MEDNFNYRVLFNNSIHSRFKSGKYVLCKDNDDDSCSLIIQGNYISLK